MQIMIEIREHYGKRRAYPVCEDAEAFARIAGTATLTKAVLEEIRSLGYDIQIQASNLQSLDL